MARLFALVAVLCLFAACGRKTSAEYAQARDLFNQVYAEKQEAAYGDPRMGEVEQLLSQVSARSVDASAAEELKQKIAAGRAALGKGTGSQPSDTGAAKADPWANWKPSSAPPPKDEDAEQPPDAGSPHPAVGMSTVELKARFSNCFSFLKSVSIEGVPHDVWTISERFSCQKDHPGFDQQLLVLDAPGKAIEALAPLSAMQTEKKYYYPDGGEAPPPPPAR